MMSDIPSILDVAITPNLSLSSVRLNSVWLLRYSSSSFKPVAVLIDVAEISYSTPLLESALTHEAPVRGDVVGETNL